MGSPRIETLNCAVLNEPMLFAEIKIAIKQDVEVDYPLRSLRNGLTRDEDIAAHFCRAQPAREWVALPACVRHHYHQGAIQ